MVSFLTRSKPVDPDSVPIEKRKYPYDFSLLAEGDIEPNLNKRIEWLINADTNFVVFVGDDGFVYWDMNDNGTLAKYGDSITRVAVLESIATNYLPRPQLLAFRRLIGEGVARLFEQNADAAKVTFDRAEEWIKARNKERARMWFLEGATVIAVPVAVWLAYVIYHRADWRGLLTASVFDVVVGACAGAIGAWMSVVQRTRETELDISAGRSLHWLEGFARIVIGTLGAALFALGIKANMVLSFARQREVAINPVNPMPFKTLFHEVAHVLLGHTTEAAQSDSEMTPLNLKEAEAEAVALLCSEALSLDGAEHCRGYIQHWWGKGNALPERSAQRIFKAADQILRAGRGEGE